MTKPADNSDMTGFIGLFLTGVVVLAARHRVTSLGLMMQKRMYDTYPAWLPQRYNLPPSALVARATAVATGGVLIALAFVSLAT